MAKEIGARGAVALVVGFDAVGIRKGGGATLLREFITWLPSVRAEWRWLLFLLPRHCREFDDPPHPRIRVEQVRVGDSALGRLWWLYHELPKRSRQAQAQVWFAFANVASPRNRVPQVVYVHQLLAFSDLRRTGFGWALRAYLKLLRWLIVRGALKSEAVIVQTQDMRRRLEAAAPGFSGRIHVVPGFVSNAEAGFEVRLEKRPLIEESPVPRLVYPAHPLLHKNHINLIKALPKILERYPTAVLLLTMEGDGQQQIVQRIRRLANDLEVHKQVSWLGTLQPGEVRYLLRQATVMVFPSLDESFELPLAEAIVEGCPIAAADLPYAREVAGPAAVYFDPLDPCSIASTVCELISRADLRNELRRQAAARKSLFEPRAVAEQIAEIIEQAVSNGAARGSLAPGGKATIGAVKDP